MGCNVLELPTMTCLGNTHGNVIDYGAAPRKPSRHVRRGIELGASCAGVTSRVSHLCCCVYERNGERSASFRMPLLPARCGFICARRVSGVFVSPYGCRYGAASALSSRSASAITRVDAERRLVAVCHCDAPPPSSQTARCSPFCRV